MFLDRVKYPRFSRQILGKRGFLFGEIEKLPWKVFKKGSQFAVYKIDAAGKPVGEALGMHDTKEKARAQQSALYASENTRAVKFVPGTDDVIEGLGMPFGGVHNGNDLAGEHFSLKTDFCFGWFQERPLLYHHGLDSGTGTSVIGCVKNWEVKSDLGVWTKAQLDKSNEYFEGIKDLVAKGKLFFSSGSMRHLVDVDRRSGEIKRWPFVELSLTPTPANLLAEVGFSDAAKHFDMAGLKSTWDGAYRAVWSTAVINDLPDSAFAYIESGGEKDEDGKTTPRSLRHFPYRNRDGDLDAAHVRNALARIPQSTLPEEVKNKALEVVRRAAKELEIQVSESKALDPDELRDMIEEMAEEMDLEMPEAEMEKMMGEMEDLEEEEAKAYCKKHMQAMKTLTTVDLDVLSEAVKPRKAHQRIISKIAKDLDVDENELAVRCGDTSSMSRSQVAKHAAEHAKAIAGAKKSNGVQADIGMKAVAWEEIRREVETLLRKRLGADSAYDLSNSAPYCYVERTFPAYVIAEVCSGGVEKHYRIPFALGIDGHVISLGEPTEVEEIYVPIPASSMPLGMQSEVVKSGVASLVERTKVLHQSRLKEGRVLSTPNRERLQQCLSVMKDACSELENLLESTLPVRAVNVQLRRQRRMKALELYAATV